MQARVAREGEVYVISLSGYVDVETAESFRAACLDHLGDKKVVFDFRSLSFVGSSGILPFLETMQRFATRNAQGLKFSGVGTEFRRVFASTELATIEIYESYQPAVQSFLRGPVLEAAQAAPLTVVQPAGPIDEPKSNSDI